MKTLAIISTILVGFALAPALYAQDSLFSRGSMIGPGMMGQGGMMNMMGQMNMPGPRGQSDQMSQMMDQCSQMMQGATGSGSGKPNE
jgi:hypothetical protein